jgi:hypothetical protein
VGAKEIKLSKQSIKATDGKITFKVDLRLPEGFKINPLAPMSYRVDPQTVSAPAASSLVPRVDLGKFVKLEQPATKFEFSLPVAANAHEDQLKIGVRYYYCREGKEGVCKTGSVLWVVPLAVDENADGTVDLEHTIAQ